MMLTPSAKKGVILHDAPDRHTSPAIKISGEENAPFKLRIISLSLAVLCIGEKLHILNLTEYVESTGLPGHPDSSG